MEKSTRATPGKRRRLLSQRLLLSFLVLAVLASLALIQAFAIQRSGLRQMDFVRAGVLERARLVASTHDQWLAESHNLLAAMVAALNALPARDRGCTGLFKDFVARAEGFDTVLLANARGDLTCAPVPVTRRVNFADRSYFKQVMATKAFSVGEYIVGRISGKRVVPVALPILDAAGEIESVVIAGKELDWLGSIMEQQAFEHGSIVTLLDRNGIVLGQYPDGEAAREKPFPDPAVRDALKSRAFGVVESAIPEEDHRLVGFTRLSQVGGDVYVVFSVPKEHATTPVEEITRSGNQFLALTISVMLVTLWAGLGVLVLQPMERIRSAMERASQGDLSVRLGEMGLSAEIRAICASFDSMASALSDAKSHLEQLATVDPLLSIANRRKFDEALDKEWRRARRGHKPIALLMIDLDLFKHYNDRYGHPAGDECLKRVVKAVDEALRRPGDLLARYGGEELVCVLPETDLAGAVVVSETVRANVYEENIAHKDGIDGRITVSVGAAVARPDDSLFPEDLVDAADRALYACKDAGRNRMESTSLRKDFRRTGSDA